MNKPTDKPQDETSHIKGTVTDDANTAGDQKVDYDGKWTEIYIWI
jgi:hypothetical protein